LLSSLAGPAPGSAGRWWAGWPHSERRWPSRTSTLGLAAGEGPHWDAASHTLLLVDTPLGQVHRLDPVTGKQTTLQLDSPIGFAISSGGGSVTVGIG
jgi:sugar lactone lactonase YvrE